MASLHRRGVVPASGRTALRGPPQLRVQRGAEHRQVSPQREHRPGDGVPCSVPRGWTQEDTSGSRRFPVQI